LKKVVERLGSKEKSATFAPALSDTLLEELRRQTVVKKLGPYIRMGLWKGPEKL
jgi:hypothetical protein